MTPNSICPNPCENFDLSFFGGVGISYVQDGNYFCFHDKNPILLFCQILFLKICLFGTRVLLFFYAFLRKNVLLGKNIQKFSQIDINKGITMTFHMTKQIIKVTRCSVGSLWRYRKSMAFDDKKGIPPLPYLSTLSPR